MVTATIDPYPHPAFPEALLPGKIRAELQRDPKRHYPQRYLDQLKAMDSEPSKVRQR